MDIAATQVLPDDDDDSIHNLAIDPSTPQKRIRQVANLWIGRKKYPIFEGINKIGRNSTSDIVLSHSTVSKNHAEIEAHANSAFICDLESSNKSRVNDVILRPHRFYQVDDGTQITFGTINAQYLFLRGFDNSILVPDTPIPGTRVHRNSSNFTKNSNNSSIDVSDGDSIVAFTQRESHDDGVFAIPSSRNRQKKIANRSVREHAERTEISIHDVATQQYVQPEDVDETIHNCQTQKMLEVQVCEPHQSVYDLETQKFDATNMVDTDTGEREIGKFSERRESSIHELETQILNSTDEPSRNISAKKSKTLEEKAQSIHDLETQQFVTVDFNDKSSKGRVPLRDEVEDIHNLETQKIDTAGDIQRNLADAVRYDLVSGETRGIKSRQHPDIDDLTLVNKSNKDKCEMNKNVRVNGTGSNGVDSAVGIDSSKNSLSNTLSNHHIINETDDESETDEEGVFCNVKIDNAKNDGCKKSVNKINESDSETDEEGEFEAMRPNCITSCVNSNKYDSVENGHVTNAGHAETPKDPKSLCSNDRSNSPILADFDQLPTQIVQKMRSNEENDEIINSDDDDDDMPTQYIDNTKKRHMTGSTNENEDNNDEMSLTPPRLTLRNRKSVQTTKKTRLIDFIPNGDDDDDDAELTQIIEMPKKKMPVRQLSKVDCVQSSQLIPTAESETVIKKDAQLNQPDGDGHGETTACTRYPRVVIEKASITQNYVVPIIAGPATIMTKSDELNNMSYGTNCPERSELLLNELKEKNKIWDDQYFDDTTPTQVIDVQASRIVTEKNSKVPQVRNVRNKSKSGNRKQRGDNLSDKNNVESKNGESITKSLAERSRMVLKSRRNDTAPLNDSITENLANLFGGESEENHLNAQSPMATQILEEVLGNTDFDPNKPITRLQNMDDTKPSSSPDTDSQDVYFSKLRTKRKHNVILHSQDSTESESGDKISSLPVGSLIFEPGTSGFKDGVAITSEESIGICKSNKKQLRWNSKLQGNVKESAPKTGVKASREETKQENEGDDILADDLESFEKKRRRRLDEAAAKKALSKKKLCKVSLDDLQKDESASTATTNKILESSDDEDLNYEELKKMAVGFIAADTKPKELSIKLEKMKNTQNYRTTSENRVESTSASPTVKLEIIPRRTRGRPRKKIDPVTIPQNEENSMVSDHSIGEAPPRKRAKLPISVIAPDSNSSSESQEGHMLIEKSMSEERNRRNRKLPIKLRSSETNCANENQLTPIKMGKSRARVVNSPSAPTCKMNHKVLFTGLPGFDYEADVKSCGGIIIEKSEQATILVTDKIRRTNKFFCAISRHIPIVSEAWIKDSAAQKAFVDWSEYILDDPATEAKYNFKLRASLERASKKKLFEGFVFIVTPRVTQPGFDEIKSMVQMSGGKALVRAPKLWQPNTIIISCIEDVPKVQDILSKVSKNIQPRVHTVEFILLGILKQELDYTGNQIELSEN